MSGPTLLLVRLLLIALPSATLTARADELADVQRLYQAGQAAVAMQRADEFLALRPKDTPMRFVKGVMLADAKRDAEAITLFQAITEDHPDLAEPYNNLAALYAGAGDYAKARTTLEQALRANPSYATAHENLGDVYAALAAQSYARVLRLEPANSTVPPKLALVRDLYKQGKRVVERRGHTPDRRQQMNTSSRASRARHLVTTCATAALVCFAGSALAQKVKLSTSAGDIVVELDAAKAPKTVENFIAYVKAGHYNGTVFHRVIPTFMVQGGGMTADMKEKPTRAPIPLESRNGLSNVRGSIAMARTNDPNSATSQFFINVKDNDRLDAANSRDGNGYAVFGKVVAGMDVVDKIRDVPTGAKGMHDDVPLAPITIKQATLEK